MRPTECPFCQRLTPERILAASDAVVAFFDGFPISPGHALVVPKQHVASLFDLPEPKYCELWGQVARGRHLLAEKFHPSAFNVGVNDGMEAGQTVGHAHVHIIPRYAGDVPDPRGGIRWIVPAKAVAPCSGRPDTPSNSLHQHLPEGVDDARNPEKEAEDEVDEGVFAGVGLEIDRQRRNEDGKDDEDNLVHAVQRSATGGRGEAEGRTDHRWRNAVGCRCA